MKLTEDEIIEKYVKNDVGIAIERLFFHMKTNLLVYHVDSM